MTVLKYIYGGTAQVKNDLAVIWLVSCLCVNDHFDVDNSSTVYSEGPVLKQFACQILDLLAS